MFQDDSEQDEVDEGDVQVFFVAVVSRSLCDKVLRQGAVSQTFDAAAGMEQDTAAGEFLAAR
jgi:hypothetical protein